MGFFGTLNTITGRDVGVGNDAKWGSLGRYSPLQEAIMGGGETRKMGLFVTLNTITGSDLGGRE